MKYQVGFIGAGGIAEIHSACIADIEGCFLKSVYDINADRAQRLAEKFGAGAVGNPVDIFSDPDIAAVYVLTHDDTHALYARQALQAGKHVFLEKPVSRTGKEAYTIRAALLQSTGTKLAVGFNMRFAPAVERTKQLFAEYSFKPDMIHISITPPPFFNQHEGALNTGFEVLRGLGSHALDLAEYIGGSIVSNVMCKVTKIGSNNRNVDNGAVMLLHLENGTLCSVMVNDSGTEAFHVSGGRKLTEIVAYGNGMTFETDAYGAVTYSFGDKIIKEDWHGKDRYISWGYLKENRLFFDALENPCKQQNPGLEYGIQIAACVDAAIASAKSGKWVKPSDCSEIN